MNQNKGKQENEKASFRGTKIKMALTVGLAAGVIWGAVSLLAYYMQFTDVGTSMYAKPLLNPDYVLKWQGHFIGLGFFIIVSVVFSFIYAFLFIKFKTPWAGVAYGLLLWALVFLILNPMFHLTKSVKELGLNSNSVMISVYTLLGLFIGFSLSAEFNNLDKS